MPRMIRCVLLLFLPVCAACSAVGGRPHDTIEDVRLDIDQCPVHDETLIESVEQVDWERGQYHPAHYLIRKELFPLAYDDPHEMGDLALVKYCPKCRMAKAEYLADDQYHNATSDFENWQEATEAYIARKRQEFAGEHARSR